MFLQKDFRKYCNPGDVFARPLSRLVFILCAETQAQDEDEDTRTTLVVFNRDEILQRYEAFRRVWEENNELLRIYINRDLYRKAKDTWKDLKEVLPLDEPEWKEIDVFLAKCSAFKQVKPKKHTSSEIVEFCNF